MSLRHRPMTRLAVTTAAALSCMIALTSCGAAPTNAAPSTFASISSSLTTSAQVPSATPSSSVPAGKFKDCPLNTLPKEAGDTVRLIKQGGPFPYPKNDGVTFRNREKILPQQNLGYYREHTVITPGSKTRGTRRVITGGQQPTTPEVWYYTQDHYTTFCTISGT